MKLKHAIAALILLPACALADSPSLNYYQGLRNTQPQLKSSFLTVFGTGDVFRAGTIRDDTDGLTTNANHSAIVGVNKSKYEKFRPGFGIQLGYDWGPQDIPFRVAAEYQYKSNASYNPGDAFSTAPSGGQTTLKSDLHTQLFLADLYFDLARPGATVIPYVGASFGASINTTSSTSTQGSNTDRDDNETETGGTWGVGFGTRYLASDNVAVDIGYRFLDLGDARWSLVNNQSLKSTSLRDHEFHVGLSFLF